MSHHDHHSHKENGCCDMKKSCDSGNGKGDCHNGNCGLILMAAAFGAIIVACWVGVLYFAGGHGAAGEGPAKYAEHPRKIVWPFEGIQGSVDRAAAQRGFQVYKEVCSACHGMSRVAFRNLQEIGFSEAEVKALAKDYSYKALNDAGEEVERPGLPADKMPSPFPNEQAARAGNNGAYPPDLSLIVKARHDGANYIYSLLTGYKDAPADFPLGDGMNYNPYFEGRQIAMAAPLSEGAVTYEDGTNATVDQMARDVVTFLQWAAEPEMEHRKSMGLRVMVFLAIGAVFFYIAKRRIWKDVH